MSGGRVNLDELDTPRFCEQGFELELVSPASGRPLSGRIRIRGYDSATYQDTLEQQQRRVLERTAMRKPPTVEEVKAESIESAAALVMGWTCPFDLDGKAFDYTAENAKILLHRFPWVREQVERAAGVRANFLSASARN